MIGLIDVDLLHAKTNFPNLALMKLAGFYRDKGEPVRLVRSLEDAIDCNQLFASKVFTATPDPSWFNFFPSIVKGGTGYNLQNAEPLPNEIEHARPFYDIYAPIYDNLKGDANVAFKDASIGFLTRGCFRQCPFCVNKNKTRVEPWSPLQEFLDNRRKIVFLWDDNNWGYKDAPKQWAELIETGKRFSFRQGLDVRLTTPEKAQLLDKAKYFKFPCFAFDIPQQEEYFIKGASILRKYCNKDARVYCLTGFYGSGLDEIELIARRVKICWQFEFFPFLMRHENYIKNPLAPIIVDCGRFFNNMTFARRGDLMTFLGVYGCKGTKRILNDRPDVRKVLEGLKRD